MISFTVVLRCFNLMLEILLADRMEERADALQADMFQSHA